jgi:ABC-type sugar transport system ATPase subunit
MPMMRDFMLEVRSIGIRYRQRCVLHDLSLNVRDRELMVLVGESGVGKSTLLRMIVGLDQPDEGTISIEGRDQSKIPPHQRDVAVVFQSGNGYDHLTVRENLKLAASLPSSLPLRELGEVASVFGLDRLLDQKLSELSGGQVQRVAIARATLTGKRLLLMDEPLAHLDEPNRASLRQLIRTWHRDQGKTMLYVTHDSEEALALADRIAVIQDGRISQVGSPSEIYNKPATATVANLFSHSPMSIVRLPSEWLGTADTQQVNEVAQGGIMAHRGVTVQCGIRAHWWHSVTFAKEREQIPPAGFVPSDGSSEIALVGKLESVLWLGDRWQLGVQVPSAQCDELVWVTVNPEQYQTGQDQVLVHCRVSKETIHRFETSLR